MADQEDQQLGQADVDAALAPATGGGGEAGSGAPPSSNASQGLSQADIDAALAGAETTAGDDAGKDDAAATADTNVGLTQADIDAALAGASTPATAVESATEGEAAQAASAPEGAPPPADPRLDSTGKPFDEIAAAMAAEIEEAAQQSPAAAGAASPPAGSPPDLSGATPLELDVLSESQAEASAMAQGIGLLSDVELHVKIELGRAQKTIEEVLALGSGSVVELDRLAGDPVDIYANERLVARGEVLVLNDNLCIRVNEIASRESGAEVA